MGQVIHGRRRSWTARSHSGDWILFVLFVNVVVTEMKDETNFYKWLEELENKVILNKIEAMKIKQIICGRFRAQKNSNWKKYETLNLARSKIHWIRNLEYILQNKTNYTESFG